MVWILFWLVVLFNFLDAYQTQLLLETGLIAEINPLQRYIIEHFSYLGMYVFKAIWLVLLGIGIYYHKKVLDSTPSCMR